MPPAVYVGFAVCGASTSQPATAEVRDVSSGAGGTVVPNLVRHIEPLGPSSRRSGLVISEIMYRPRDRTDGRNLAFIEIFNSDPISEDMSGYRISGDVDYKFSPGTILQPGAFLVVAQSPADMQAVYGISGVHGPYSNLLSRSAGTIRLRNDADAILNEIEYGSTEPWPLAADGAGHSMVLARPSYGEADPRAWAASDLIGGSPGRADSVGPEPLRNLVINEFLARTTPPAQDYIEIHNHSTTPLDITGCWLSDSPSTNKFQITNSTVLGPRQFAVFYESQLGFGLNSSGEKIFLVNSNQTRVLDAWSFEAQGEGIPTGRFPDGSDNIDKLAALTPGTTNAAALRPDIVINELMYDPISGDGDDEYIELYNRGTSTVNIGGWKFTAGVDHTLPENTFMPPGAYYIVAKNRDRLLANYPNLIATNVFGNFDGNLNNGGERLALARRETFIATNGSVLVTNTLHVVVSEVVYGRGRFHRWAHGGGSSLELIDSHSDARQPFNWVDSDETAKSEWITVNHRELTDHAYPVDLANGGQLNEVQIMILGAGEALVDDVEVRSETPGPGPNLLNNGSFSSGTTGWLIQGNHVASGLEPPGPNNPSPSLRLRASAAGDNGANRVETDLTAVLARNTNASIRARLRWLRGHREVLIRTHGGGLETVVLMPVPANLGTPGVRNSRAVTNAGPVIDALAHSPILPAASQNVTVTARVSDPDGVAQVVLRYRNDTATPGVSVDVPMNDAGANGDLVAGDGTYTGILPGQAANVLAAFHVRATDNGSPAATSAYPDASNRHEALVRFGESLPIGSFGVYRLWMTASNMSTWATRERLSNQAQEGTFVYGNRVVHGMGARYRGSPFIRPGYSTPTGNACGYVWTFPDDDMFLGQDETNLDSLEPSGRDSTALREITSFTIVQQLGLPFSRQRFVHVVINGVNNTSRSIPIYTDSQQPDSTYFSSWFPDNDDGDIYKVDDWFEFNDTPGMQGNKSASLQNFTTVGGVKKQARYRWSWEKKFNGGYTDDYSSLFETVNALNAPDAIYVSQVEGSLNTEEWLSALALRHVVSDWDGYGYNRGKNQFAYRPRGGKFHMLLWDLDFAIGCTGGHGPEQDLFTVAQGGDGGSDHMPEVARLYNHPYFRRIYLRALLRAAQGPLQVTNYMPILDARYRALQGNGVTTVSPYVGSGAQGISLPNWIDRRRTNILGIIPAATFGLTTSSATVPTNLVTISGTAPIGVRTILIDGAAWPVTWTSTTAWSVRVPLDAASNRLEVVGLNVDGQAITATNIFTAFYTGAAPNPQGQIVINEIMYNPAVPGAEYIELFNTSSNFTFDLSGWEVRGVDYIFPPGSFIGPRSFLVLTRDRVGFSMAYGIAVGAFDQYNGALQGNGEMVSLIRPPATTNDVATIIDRVRYEGGLPWSTNAHGTGSAYQLIDPNQENARAGNWFANFVPAVYCCGSSTPAMTNDGWRFMSVSGNIANGIGSGQMRLMIYLGTELGSAIIDDVSVVAGTNAGVGPNFVRNGDFESTPLLEDPALTNSWTIGTNYTNTAIINNLVHGGNGALKIVASSFGNSFPRIISQFLSPAPEVNTTNTLSFWYWATNSSTNLNVRIQNSAQVSAATNINVFIVPSNYVPPQVVSPATNTLSPGAANQFTTNLPPFPPLWINEVQAENLTGILDNAGEREPWIEIFNTSTSAVSLDGLYLSGGPAQTAYTNLTQWAFPPGASIGPTQFLVVFADAEAAETGGGEYHTSFRLPAASGSVALSRLHQNAPQVLDYVNYAAGPDRSYGSFPDGQPFERLEFFYVTPRGTNDGRAAPLVVRINEWMAANTNTLTDPADNDFDDWFELYNPTANTVDLAGYYLTDVLADRTKYLITTNGPHTIPPGGYLLVWADNETGQNTSGGVPRSDLHVSFQLARAGEGIGLFAADGTQIDAITFTNQMDDVSEGRCPDGASSVITMTNPTPRLANAGCVIGNNAPVLGPIGNRIIYLGQTLTFTAMATDSDLPPQQLNFTLDAGAPAGASINPNTGAFTWTPSTPGIVNITVRVADNGTPIRSDSETIAVQVIGGPSFTSSVRNGNNFEMSWATSPGEKYAVEYKNDLNAPVWTPLVTNTATGLTLSYTNTILTPPQRFFRIRLVE
jgi:hypothetical protein